VDLVDLTGNALEFCDDLADAVAWCADPAALRTVLSLVDHPEPAVRRAVAQVLPRLTTRPRPTGVVPALITLSDDLVAEVRDCACHALGTRLSDVDTPEVRDALIARLSDRNRDVRGEALIGLARRHDPRVLPVLRRCLAGDDVWLIEMMAAGAIGHPSLHELVRGQLSGWRDDVVPKVCATLRLTDPEGVGADLIDGLAEWYAGPMTRRIADRYWWSVALNLLEQAEYRSVELADAVLRRIRGDSPGDRAGVERLCGSMLGRTAAAYGWTPS
jgi:HEAT repeats